MARGIKKKIQQAVRKLSYRTTVDQLKKKGINRVNVVGIDRISALIETAVHRTLKARMALGFDPDLTHGEIANETRAEFLRLLRNKESLKKVQKETEEEKESLKSQVGKLQEELQTLQREIEEKRQRFVREERVRTAAEDEALVQAVQELLGKIDSGTGKAAEIQEELLALFLGRLEEERKRVRAQKEQELRKEVDLLNRRLHKVTQTLDQTEGRLQQALSGQVEDLGVSSIYKEVQGLSSSDPEFKKKKSLMTSIFEANLELQKGSSSA
ncbi:MAG TPA: hypothetical protein ENK02_02100 [Planctomycetes bacterium]|nr:hypothetical protein [Planctomycetota bacterium]